MWPDAPAAPADPVTALHKLWDINIWTVRPVMKTSSEHVTESSGYAHLSESTHDMFGLGQVALAAGDRPARGARHDSRPYRRQVSGRWAAPVWYGAS